MIDAESQEVAWIDTARKGTREAYEKWYRSNLVQTRNIFLRSGADFVSINTKESYISALLNLFTLREKRQ